MIAPLLAAAALGGGGGAEPVYVERQMEWALAGVSRDGRTLTVQPGLWGGCDKGPPEVRVRETRAAIEIESIVMEPDDIEVVLCPAIAGVSRPVRVALDAPVGGRPITGPGESSKPGAAMFDGGSGVAGERRVPRVVGLRAVDARAVLCGWLVRARGASGERVVTTQSVRPGTTLPGTATAAPARCSALPAQPSVRLRATAR